MIRKNGFSNNQYNVVIPATTVFDAIEWCKNYRSNSMFDMVWQLDWDGVDDVCGLFYFDNQDDYTLFCMRWC